MKKPQVQTVHDRLTSDETLVDAIVKNYPTLTKDLILDKAKDMTDTGVPKERIIGMFEKFVEKPKPPPTYLGRNPDGRPSSTRPDNRR